MKASPFFPVPRGHEKHVPTLPGYEGILTHSHNGLIFVSIFDRARVARAR